MTSKDKRFQIYKKYFDAMPLKKFQLARLFNLGQPATKSVQSTIDDKLSQRVGITKADATSIQLLYILYRILASKGIPITDIEFKKNGFVKDKWIDEVIKKLGS